MTIFDTKFKYGLDIMHVELIIDDNAQIQCFAKAKEKIVFLSHRFSTCLFFLILLSTQRLFIIYISSSQNFLFHLYLKWRNEKSNILLIN